METLQTSANKKEFQTYIIERRDLLVPQDIRERKRSIFHSQTFGLNFHKNICADYWVKIGKKNIISGTSAAGTGNLLAGLTNKYKHLGISTIDQADVKVMHDRIKHGANFIRKSRFSILTFWMTIFRKLPQGLQDIINDRKKT